MVFLLIVGRCYEAEICVILLRLDVLRLVSFYPRSNFSISGRKPWTIVRRFDRNRGYFIVVILFLAGRSYMCMKLKLRHSARLEIRFSPGILAENYEAEIFRLCFRWGAGGGAFAPPCKVFAPPWNLVVYLLRSFAGTIRLV